MNWYKKAKYIEAGVIAYHGTGSKFENFENSTNIHTKLLNVPTYFFTDNKAVASSYAKGKNPNIIKAYLDYKKPLFLDANGGSWEEMLPIINEKLIINSTKEEEIFKEIQNKILSKYNPDDLKFNWDNTVSEEDKQKLIEYSEKANRAMIDKKNIENKSPGERASAYSINNDIVIIQDVMDMGGEVSDDFSSYNPYSTVYMVLDKNIIKILKK